MVTSFSPRDVCSSTGTGNDQGAVKPQSALSVNVSNMVSISGPSPQPSPRFAERES